MALVRAKPHQDDLPEVPDNGQPVEPEGTSTATPVAQTPAPAKEKSKDTYVKLKLAADKATPDTWFILSETRPDGIKVFKNERREMTAMIHPERSAIMLYKNDSVNNFFDADSKKRNVGLLGRFYVSASKTTPEKPESRLYVSGKFHAEGLMEQGGALRVDSIQVFGGIVGLESAALMSSLKEKADTDRKKAEEYKARQAANAPTAPAAPVAPKAPQEMRPGDDLEFGM